MKTESIYQSILNQLSQIPTSYLYQVDSYLKKLSIETHRKEKNRLMILQLAGSWNDMPENEFQDFLLITKTVQNDMFNRNISL